MERNTSDGLRAYLTNLVVEDVKDSDIPGLKKVTYSYDDRICEYEGFFHIEEVINNRLIVEVGAGSLEGKLVCVHPVVDGGFHKIDGILVDPYDLIFSDAIQPESVPQSYDKHQAA